MLRDYSIELDPADYHGQSEEDFAHEIAYWLSKMYDEAMAGERYYWLAFDAGQPIGFISFRLLHGWFDGSQYGKLDEFYIAPSARGQGTGRELAQMAFTEMQRQGAGNVELGVLISNTSGLAFWQSIGLKVNHQVLRMPLAVD
jgi:ribosomal protein S18 acetylase RimI-like enzyme